MALKNARFIKPSKPFIEGFSQENSSSIFLKRFFIAKLLFDFLKIFPEQALAVFMGFFICRKVFRLDEKIIRLLGIIPMAFGEFTASLQNDFLSSSHGNGLVQDSHLLPFRQQIL